jgi:uncharacterized protein YoxC
MKKTSKRAMLLLVIAIMVVSLLPIVPVHAAVQIDSVSSSSGVYDDTIKVYGSGVTAGVKVELGWDSLAAWDGEKGILNSTTAAGDGTYEVWFDVPEATNGVHNLWVRDTDTKQTWGGKNYADSNFTVNAKIKFDPSSGLKTESITVYGYGYDAEEDIIELVFDTAYYNFNISMSPSTPETDELGSWDATFKVPDYSYATYTCQATQRGTIIFATATFTIGPAIVLDVDEGPVGSVVEIRGRGFANGVTIKTGNVTLNGTPCNVIDEDTVSSGKFTIDVIIPTVADEDEYTLAVNDGTNTATETFEVTGLPEIELDPEFAVQGESISIKGYNFTQKSGTEVSLELWNGYLTDIKTFETDSKGEFSGKFTVPARSSGVYTMNATQGDYNIWGSASFRIGLMIVIPSPSSGPSGTLVTLTGTGFTANEKWNATLGGVTIVDDGNVDADSNLEFAPDEVPTFFVPTMDPGTYTISVLDIDSDIPVEADFTVTAKTMVETDPLVAPNGYNVTIEGKYFSAEEGTALDFVLYNVTAGGDVDIDFDMTVEYGGTAVETDEDGNFTGYWGVPDSDTLSLGDYWINVTDDNDLYAQYLFSLVEKTVDIEPRKASFAIGATVAFDIESSFIQPDSYIKIWTPDGELYWKTDKFETGIWVKVGVIERVPYYEQTAGGNPMVLEDVPLGTWSWTWYDKGADELDSGTFTVTEAPADVLGQQITELTGDLESLTEDFTGLTEDVEALSGAVTSLADSVSTAISAANAAKAAADDAADAISDIAETANSAKTSADSAKAAADAAKESADQAGEAASGLTTLVYGAIGASLIAALAAIVSLMQISRRIAG